MSPSSIEKAYTTLVVHKAKRIALKKTYKAYRAEALNEFKIVDLDHAFLIGAIDGMLYEMAATLGQAYMKPQLRKRVLRQIWTAIGFRG
jgi:hypothetical protein